MNLLNLKAHKFSEDIPIKADPLIAVLNELEPAINVRFLPRTTCSKLLTVQQCFADAAKLLFLPHARLLESKRNTLSKTIKAVVINYSPKTPKVRRTFTA